MSVLTPQRTRANDTLRINDTTWRVLSRSGRPIGNVVAIEEAAGTRFHARRYHVPTGTHMQLGAFWTFEEARSCLRWL